MAWDVLSGVTKTAWDVLSGVANGCGMFCRGMFCPTFKLSCLSQHTGEIIKSVNTH